MKKIVNPTYVRMGFALGFGLGSILLPRYAWYGLVPGEYFHNFSSLSPILSPVLQSK